MLQERIPAWWTIEVLGGRIRQLGIIGSALACVVVSVPTAGLVAVAANAFWPASRSDLNSLGVLGMVLLAILIGPLIETIFFQLLIGTAIRSFVDGFLARLVIISIPFALSHFLIGISSGLSAGIVGGLMFGFLFVAWQEISSLKAFAATMLAHCCHNSIILLVDHLFGSPR